MPRLLTENVEPVYCSGLSLRSRASFASSFDSREISLSRFRSASKMTGYDEAIVRGHGHSQMHAIVLADPVAQPMRVHLGVLRERGRDRFQHNVVDGDLERVSQLEHGLAHLRRARVRSYSAVR